MGHGDYRITLCNIQIIQVEVWMCSSLGACPEDKEPVSGSGVGVGWVPPVSVPLELEEPPAPRLGSVPSTPSSPGLAFKL